MLSSIIRHDILNQITGLRTYLELSREILAITGITITENGEPGTGVLFEMTVPKSVCRYTL
jgi:hypothetical protein